jgi:hypothetical protein
MDNAQHRVAAYRNLHKPGVIYSLRGISSGLVRGYADAVVLTDVDFKVSQAGRLRVIAQKRKNVHAYVCGNPYILDLDSIGPTMEDIEVEYGVTFTKVTYNPYRFTSFVRVEDGTPVNRAAIAVLKSDGCWAIRPN